MTHLSAGYTSADYPAVFLAPHADDETLSMGLDIANHAVAGRNILIVLVTRGCSDYALAQINGRDDTYGYTHDPVLENYHLGRALTKAELGQIRINEFISATGRFNRISGRIRVRGADIPDGTTTQAAMEQIIRDINTDVGGRASFKTMSYTDPASDHYVCGNALRNLKQQGVVTDARYFISNRYTQNARDAGVTPIAVSSSATSIAAVKDAVRCYDAWNPYQGSYAFGRHSVSPQIDTQGTQPTQWYHA